MNITTQFKYISPKDIASIGVSALFLFGSRALGIPHKRSDYDIGVLLQNLQDYENDKKLSSIYTSVYDLISDGIGEMVNIDVVFLDGAPSELQMHVLKYGRLIVSVSNCVVADFRQRAMEHAADFEPHRRVFSEATLARIN